MARRKSFSQLLVEEGMVDEVAIQRLVAEARALDLPLGRYLIRREICSRAAVEELLRRRKYELRLGDLLLESGVVASPAKMAEALLRQGSGGGRIGEVLEALGLVERGPLMETLCHQLGIPRVVPEPELSKPITPAPTIAYQQHHGVLPYHRDEHRVMVLMSDPFDHAVRRELETFYSGLEVAPAYAAPEELEAYFQHGRLWEEARRVERAAEPVVELRPAYPLEHEEESPGEGLDAVKAYRFYLRMALREGASDLHFEPLPGTLRIRFAVDGVLRTVTHLPPSLGPRLTALLKTGCGLDTTQRHRPADGRASVAYRGREYHLRLSTYPALQGENCVIRILADSSEITDVDELGLSPRNLRRLKRCLDTPSGILLVTGPTGSGKSTTLYAALRHLAAGDARHLITVEDPVEYVLPGVTQGALNEARGFGYPEAIAAIMRQNPDVIMVGEVRDQESANAIVRGALTGHKVLTTLHTATADGAYHRLAEMGIPRYLLADTVELVLSQRLARRVCATCAGESRPDPGLLRALALDPADWGGLQLRHGTGALNGHRCPDCNGSGYRGRIALHETLRAEGGVAADVDRRRRVGRDLVTLKEDGLYKVLRGETTLEELVRFLPDPEEPAPSMTRLMEEYESPLPRRAA